MSYMAGACTGHLFNIIFGWWNNVPGRLIALITHFFELHTLLYLKPLIHTI